MAEYIDAEKLITEISAYRERCENSYQPGEDNNYPFGQVNACKYILEIIDSLQQEQSEKGLDVTDFCKPINPRIAKCIADHWWEMLDGKDVEEKQPEVDLEKEAVQFCFGEGLNLTPYEAKTIARHFYELGRKQVLQEIYDGKAKPVDKITASWLDDKEEE